MDSKNNSHSKYSFGVGNPVFWLALTLIGLIIPLSHFSRTPDSIHYYDIANNVSIGKGLTTYHLTADVHEIPSPEIMWPPVYPLILAVFLKLGISAGLATIIVHVIAFLIITYALWRIGLLLHSRLLGALNVGLWLIVALQTDLPTHPLSEPVFIAISLLLLLIIIDTIKYKKYSFGYFFIAGLLAGLAFLTRFAGAALIIPVLAVPFFLLITRSLKIPDFLKIISGLLIGLIITIVPYLIYNLQSTEQLMPLNRAITEKGLFFNAVRIIITAGKDMLIAFAIIAFGFLFVAARELSKSYKEKGVFRIIISILLLWIITYSCLLLYVTSRYEMDTISTRLLIPIYPIIIILMSYLFVASSSKLESMQTAGRPVLVSMLILLAVAGASAMQLKENIKAMYLTSQKSQYPPLSAWIKGNTGSNDLVIGERIWEVRYSTGRVVLESGYPSQPPLTDSSITAFLNRFGNNFDDIYLTQNEGEDKMGGLVVKGLEDNGIICLKIGNFELENRDYVLFKLAKR